MFIFDEKFRVMVKISIFNQNFHFWRKNSSVGQISIVGQNCWELIQKNAHYIKSGLHRAIAFSRWYFNPEVDWYSFPQNSHASGRFPVTICAKNGAVINFVFSGFVWFVSSFVLKIKIAFSSSVGPLGVAVSDSWPESTPSVKCSEKPESSGLTSHGLRSLGSRSFSKSSSSLRSSRRSFWDAMLKIISFIRGNPNHWNS